MPVLKLLLLAFFGSIAPWGRLCAPIVVKFGREEEAANILLTAKVENEKQKFFTGRKAGIKITFVSLFWFHRPVGATLCTDYR